VIAEGQGMPLAFSLTGGNRERPRRRPAALYADRACDRDTYRWQTRARGIRPVIARHGVPHGSGSGTVRWVVGRCCAPLRHEAL
jgi:hypothetical protein